MFQAVEWIIWVTTMGVLQKDVGSLSFMVIPGPTELHLDS